MNGTLKRPAIIIIALMVLINAGIFAYVYFTSQSQDEQIREQITANEQERSVRTSQNCELFEREHRRDVQSLEGTYLYLKRVEERPGEKDTLLYELILRTLPRTIAEGEADIAPEYCDAPGIEAEKLYEKTNGKRGAPPVGLPEPDPEIPPRPKFLPDAIYKAADELGKV
jgi:hypothetical protein